MSLSHFRALLRPLQTSLRSRGVSSLSFTSQSRITPSSLTPPRSYSHYTVDRSAHSIRGIAKVAQIPQTRTYHHVRGKIPLQVPWPWYESSPSTADTQILQRTLFARPSDLNPALLSFAAAVWALYIATWLLLPEPRKRDPTEEERRVIEENNQRAKDANFFARLGLGFANTIFTSAQGLVYVGVSAILASFILGATRIPTRINMVQIRPRDPTKGQGTTMLRLTHVGHEMLPGGKGRSREINLEDCRLYIPNLNNPTTIRLKVTKPDGTRPRFFDRVPYNLDMKAPKDLDKKVEVVQSMNRLEHVFGPVVQAG